MSIKHPITNPPISVLIVDDHVVFRDGLRTLLANERDFHVVAEATTGQEAVDLTNLHSPHIVLMDLDMPVLNGFEAMHQIRANKPKTKLLVLSAYAESKHVERCASIGASGFISKEHSYLTVAKSIREVMQGKPFVCPQHNAAKPGAKAKKHGTRQNSAKEHLSELTVREIQVLRLVAEGGANKQVAATLGISIKTVEKHRQKMMDKLDIHDTAGLTRFAIESGVIGSAIARKNHLE